VGGRVCVKISGWQKRSTLTTVLHESDEVCGYSVMIYCNCAIAGGDDIVVAAAAGGGGGGGCA